MSETKLVEHNLNVIKKEWQALLAKFAKFQKPSDFDHKLERTRATLADMDASLATITCVSSGCGDGDADGGELVESMHAQLDACMRAYKVLSELKPQLEQLLKQGRSIVDKKQVDEPKELTRQLDELKQKYNELGSCVTSAKSELERALKMAKKLHKEHAHVADFLGKIDGELRKIEQKPLSKNYKDELEWIKNTRLEISKVEAINFKAMKSLVKSMRDESTFRALKTHRLVEESTRKLDNIDKQLRDLLERIDSRTAFLREQANALDESYESFMAEIRSLHLKIEFIQRLIVELERTRAKELFQV